MSGAAEFRAVFDVSRETTDRLQACHDLLVKWNRRINLVAKGSEADLWARHFADSAQLWAFAPPARLWADLGAGGGFPGLVIAALAAERAPELKVVLVESDLRKAVFLGEASRAMGVQVSVISERIESVAPLGADIVSARALAPLDTLLDWTERHRRPDGIGLFPKGRGVHKEIEAAEARWRFDRRLHPSLTDPEAAVVEVGALSRV